MILDVHREPLRLRIERRSLRHRPRQQHAFVLEAEVVVQVAGEVLLHAEEQPFVRLRLLRALGGDFRSPAGSGVELKLRFCLYFSRTMISFAVRCLARFAVRCSRPDTANQHRHHNRHSQSIDQHSTINNCNRLVHSAHHPLDPRRQREHDQAGDDAERGHGAEQRRQRQRFVEARDPAADVVADRRRRGTRRPSSGRRCATGASLVIALRPTGLSSSSPKVCSR